jgi:hypothetical protein
VKERGREEGRGIKGENIVGKKEGNRGEGSCGKREGGGWDR